MKKFLLSTLLFLLPALLCPIQAATSEDDGEGTPFHYITNYLSNQNVSSIVEDAKGHIWLGTFRALNKFNVYEYHQYFSTDDTLSLPDNQVKDLLVDSRGRLWVATVNGVALYTDHDNFHYIPIHNSNKNGLQLIEASNGRIFLRFLSSLCAYDPTTDTFECVISHFDPQQSYFQICHADQANNLWMANPRCIRCLDATTLATKDSVSVEGTPTTSLLLNNGELWMAGSRTLSIYDTHRRQMLPVPEAIRQNPVLAQSTIVLMHPYGATGLLLATSSHGLFYYNRVEGIVAHESESKFPFQAPQFRVSTMFTDSHQNLWIGSVDQGYKVVYSYKDRFNNNSSLTHFTQGRSITGLQYDQQSGRVWINTLTGGLWLYDAKELKVSHVSLPRELYDGDEPVPVEYIFLDREGYLWLTAGYYYVARCRYRDGRLELIEKQFVVFPRHFVEDQQGGMWIATSTKDIYTRRRGEQAFTPISLYDEDTPVNFTSTMTLLDDGRILAAAFNQKIKVIDPNNRSIRDLEMTPDDWQRSIRRSVFIPVCSMQDSRGDIWLGTIANGLLHYSPTTHQLRHVEGLPCSDVSTVEEDALGNIWVSTLYGLSRYDRTVGRFTNYFAGDGIGGNQFSERTSCRLADGTVVFGGTHGLTYFNPIDVQTKRNVPLLFEDLKVHNRLITPGSADGCIDRHLSYGPDIHLSYKQNGFSISFAALDYSEQERVHYYYQMEDIDPVWVDAHNNREAYYANLPAGHYTFRVRITNNDHSIVEAQNTIRVIVHPAPWQSWWAWTLYLILTAAVLCVAFRLLRRIQLARRAVRLAEEEKEQEQRLNQMNMNFFANVSHEFRTPLTMISGPVTQLCRSPRVAEEDRQLLQIVRRNVERMLRLVNQLLDFNRLEGDKLRLEVSRMDIIALLERIVSTFRINAEEKSVTLCAEGLVDTYLTWIDPDKLDKIVTNLMSNAMKFTPTGGRVDLKFDATVGEVRISVADSGPGIPDQEKEHIFKRYYQLDGESRGVVNWGTGIGLYYARGLAELHHGSLTVSDRTDGGTGSVFTLVLPTADEVYTEKERTRTEGLPQGQAFPLQATLPTGQLADFAESGVADRAEGWNAEQGKRTILVVDDDTDVAHYLRTLLAPRYHVVCRFDADSALQAMTEASPDLVISDVVMPMKDGYQLCRQIKEDLSLCHIPVVLVTAKVTMESQVEGLNTGADAYVTKPFDPSYLLALIGSLLANRERVRNLLTRSTQVERMEEGVLSPQDNAFMADLYRLMETELTNSELDVARMTELLSISRSKFYYKVKGLTGQNPSAFFRTYKLNRAAELIREGRHTVAEIADMTGFSTPSHFTSSFKRQFGTTPSAYATGGK